MIKVGVQVAKSQLSRLVDLVEEGEEVVIARNGRPVARLVQVFAPKTPRPSGTWKDAMQIAEDFDGELGECGEELEP